MTRTDRYNTDKFQWFRFGSLNLQMKQLNKIFTVSGEPQRAQPPLAPPRWRRWWLPPSRAAMFNAKDGSHGSLMAMYPPYGFLCGWLLWMMWIDPHWMPKFHRLKISWPLCSRPLFSWFIRPGQLAAIKLRTIKVDWCWSILCTVRLNPLTDQNKLPWHRSTLTLGEAVSIYWVRSEAALLFLSYGNPRGHCFLSLWLAPWLDHQVVFQKSSEHDFLNHGVLWFQISKQASFSPYKWQQNHRIHFKKLCFDHLKSWLPQQNGVIPAETAI